MWPWNPLLLKLSLHVNEYKLVTSICSLTSLHYIYLSVNEQKRLHERVLEIDWNSFFFSWKRLEFELTVKKKNMKFKPRNSVLKLD